MMLLVIVNIGMLKKYITNIVGFTIYFIEKLKMCKRAGFESWLYHLPVSWP